MALPSQHTTQRGRKRSKTFTGCWTCRARKVKCDEARPICGVCREKRVPCEGYDTRLQWLPPDSNPFRSGKGPDPSSPTLLSSNRSLRRHIPAVLQPRVLRWDQVEDILNTVDLLEQSWDLTYRESLSVNIHNFGVFGLGKTQGLAEPGVKCRLEPCVVHHGQSESRHDMENQVSTYLDNLLPQAEDGTIWYPVQSVKPSLATPESDPAVLDEPQNEHNQNLRERHRSAPQGTLSPISVQCLSHAGTESHYAFQSDDENSATVQPMTPTPMTSCYPDIVLSGEIPILLPEPCNSTDQERYLMYTYAYHVVNLFCVIENAKSPWKTIHLPRAMQCVGELSIHGSTTRVRRALRSALLSISAFFLSNKYNNGDYKVQTLHWRDVATRYRHCAIALLKEGVEKDLLMESRPRYKEILATMLSMVTINVISGDTQSCRVHLDGASQLIKYMSFRKIRYSGKARALHRTYLYLRVIYESTATRESLDNEKPGCSAAHGQLFRDPHSAHESVDEEQTLSPYNCQTQEIEWSSMEEPDPHDMSSFECVYGIPLCLLTLLKATIRVVNQVDAASERSKSLSLDENLSESCNHLEQEILDWPAQRNLHRVGVFGEDSSAKIIRYQTQAFHNAIIIYFSQSARQLSYRYMRQYVDNILEAIEAIEELKEETRILLAAPLFWPAFIGATEAFDLRQQERFRAWYCTIEKYGIAAVRTGITVINQIWERGALTGNTARACTWRQLVRETGDVLMLT